MLDTVGRGSAGNAVTNPRPPDLASVRFWAIPEALAGALVGSSATVLSALPSPNPDVEATREHIVLQGDLPSPANPPEGCNFCTRCPAVTDICRQKDPEWREVEPGRYVACHNVD